LRWFSPAQLSASRLRELHALLTDGVDEEPGELRASVGASTTEPEPLDDLAAPSASELETRLERMHEFAAGDLHRSHIPHLVRAILVHFWVLYERPFKCANGRVARVLYYAMLANERRPSPLSIVPISPGWLRARRTYFRAIREARADQNDTGYFVHGQLRSLRRGVERILVRTDQTRRMADAIQRELPDTACNPRQIELLTRVAARPERVVTIGEYRSRHGITYETARTDMLRLADAGLLELSKQGRAFVFRASPTLRGLKTQS
jgi:Fic family protein